MKLSIVIPTRIERGRSDRIHLLRQVIEQTLDQTARPDQYEVILVDDGSDAEIAGSLADYKSREQLLLFRQDKKGPAAARNLGTQQARGEFVLYLGDDILVDKHLVEEHLSAHARVDNAIVINNVRASERAVLGRELLETRIDNFEEGVRYPMPSGSAFCTSCVSIAKRWMGLTPFDERFPYPAYEDTEVGVRLHQQGVGFTIAAKTSAIHDHVHSIESLRRRSRNCGRSYAYSINKHPEWSTGLKHKPEAVRTRSARLFHHLFRRLYLLSYRVGGAQRRAWGLEMICRYEFLVGISEGLPGDKTEC